MPPEKVGSWRVPIWLRLKHDEVPNKKFTKSDTATKRGIRSHVRANYEANRANNVWRPENTVDLTSAQVVVDARERSKAYDPEDGASNEIDEGGKKSNFVEIVCGKLMPRRPPDPALFICYCLWRFWRCSGWYYGVWAGFLLVM